MTINVKIAIVGILLASSLFGDFDYKVDNTNITLEENNYIYK